MLDALSAAVLSRMPAKKVRIGASCTHDRRRSQATYLYISIIFSERIPALSIEHFQQNGNIKNITHIDESNNEVAANENATAALGPKKPNGAEPDVEMQSRTVDNVLAGIPAAVNEVAPVKEVIEVEIIPKGYSLIRFPKEKSCFRKIMWFVLWPIHFLFMLTIPDCERPSLKKLFPMTFIMCIVWIGSLSYMVAWMITIIGNINF